MPQPMETAVPTLLSRFTKDAAALHGRKVRIAGWYLACDLDTIVVAHAGHGVLVDLSACLAAGERGGPAVVAPELAFLSETKRKVMVMGVVDVQTDEDGPAVVTPIPELRGAAAREAGELDGRVVVRAVLVRAVDGLSLEEWERGIVAGLGAIAQVATVARDGQP